MTSEHGHKAMEAYREAGDEVGRLRAATLMSRNLIGFHLEDQAAADLTAAIEEAKPLGDVPELAGAYAELRAGQDAARAARRGHRGGGPGLAHGCHRQPRHRGRGADHQRHVHDHDPRTVEAEAILRGAIRQADDMGLIASALRARNNLSGPLGFRDEEESGRMIREGYEIANRYGHRPFVYQFLFGLLEANLRRGNWDDDIADLDAIEGNETPYPFYQIAFSGARAILAALRGDLTTAEEQARRAEERLSEVQSMQSEAYVHGLGPRAVRGGAVGRGHRGTGGRLAPTRTSPSMRGGYGQCRCRRR